MIDKLALYSYPLFVAISWGALIVLVKNSRSASLYGLGMSLNGGVIVLLLPTIGWVIYTSSTLPLTFNTWVIIGIIGILRYLLGTWFFFLSITVGDVTVSSPITGSKVVCVSVLSVLLGLDVINYFLIAAIILAMVGLYCITFHIKKVEKLRKENLVKGIIFAVGAMLSWSAADILVKKIHGLQALVLTFGSLAIALLFYYFIILLFKQRHKLVAMPRADKARYFVHGILSFGISYLILNLSLMELGIVRTNIIVCTWPLIASVIGYFYYNEKVTFMKIIGSVLLVGSVIITVLN
ncbi:MAG: DMT family transporter [Candidatus Omnitrophica bacterium]|nr:DMT family transporter [Candidatus Omnitrophota bacterium]